MRLGLYFKVLLISIFFRFLGFLNKGRKFFECKFNFMLGYGLVFLGIGVRSGGEFIYLGVWRNLIKFKYFRIF